ncbi:MAG: hypothetical protein HPY53_11565 [Brevinematales bacterium]|nr:hypothetical protein [Brevinematales bacterium]
MKHAAIIFTMLVLSAGLIFGAVQKGVSGKYDALVLAYSADGKTVSGYHKNATGYDEASGSPKFVCEFYFTGKQNGSQYDISVIDIDGSIITEGELTPMKNAVKLRLNDDPGACWNVIGGLTDEGAELSPCEPAKWIEIRMVVSQKAYFHSEPDSAKKLKSYVIKGDALRVYEKKNGWVLAEFEGAKIVKGWIKESDLLK